MDLLSDSSDGSDSDVEDAAVQDGLGGPRLHTDVGRRLDLPQFSGECLGDDMSWKRLQAVACRMPSMREHRPGPVSMGSLARPEPLLSWG